jgi:hypothetical protein
LQSASGKVLKSAAKGKNTDRKEDNVTRMYRKNVQNHKRF